MNYWKIWFTEQVNAMSYGMPKPAQRGQMIIIAPTAADALTMWNANLPSFMLEIRYIPRFEKIEWVEEPTS